MGQVFNPFLPLYEYIPDIEPHIFKDRVYLYGSHDRFNGRFFCLNDYVCYSAPIDNLSDWKYEGVIWEKKKDPSHKPLLLRQMYAPDVVQGLDGRYYLYYFIGNQGIISVAVSNTPAGKYEFYGHVKYPNGKLLGRNNEKDIAQFDPGIFQDDDGKVYLYTGFGAKRPNIFTRFRPVNYNGAMGVELGSDMLTIKEETMTRIARTVHHSKGTSYEGHEFFEASSMRKFNGKYYFIYSSVNGHELCYAMGDSPLGEFTYQGVLISIGDIGLNNRPLNYLGNTHGSVIEINGKYYVFYHRQTNRHCHSRQACAEEIHMNDDGRFVQAELTSCGLNGKPLEGKGTYNASIACHLFTDKGTLFYRYKNRNKYHPYFTQNGKDREDTPDNYIANFGNGCCCGYKYFDLSNTTSVTLEIKTRKLNGVITLKDGLDGLPIGEANVSSSSKRIHKINLNIRINTNNKKCALYIYFYGKGRLNLCRLIFQ